MKVYRLIAHDKELGTVLSWHASKAEANRTALTCDQDDPTVDAWDIPIKKRGLIVWLNRHVNSANDAEA